MSRTPGNWHQDGLKIIGNGYAIATINSHKTTEGSANARLIAAAPELLEALELAKMGLEAAIEKCRANDDRNFLGYALTLDKVNLAIAKARGE